MKLTDFLIEAADLVKYTSVGNNTDPDAYAPYIRTAQLIKVRPILGTPLYNKLLADYSAGTLSGQYQIIYDNYVADMMIYFSAANYLSFAPYQIANGGVFRHATENSDPVDIEEVKVLVTNYNSTATAVHLQFLDYMKTISIPEWPQSCSGSNSFYFPWQI